MIKRDWIGAPIVDFERAMLFDKEREHWGWFQWLQRGNTQVFQLSKSPFIGVLPLSTPNFGQMPITTYYIFENGYSGPIPDEGDFVQVEAEGPKSEDILEGNPPIRYRTFVAKNIIPIKDEELFNILPRPRLTLEEFQYQATINFKNAEADNLHLLLPLQIVSAPKNGGDLGGLIAMRKTFLQDDMRVVKSFNKGILSQIPNVFKRVNPTYYYGAISNKTEESIVPGLYRKCNEVNLFVESNTSLDINLPIIQYESTYHPCQKLTSDIVNYQLSALIYQPHISEANIKEVEDSIIKARKRIENHSVAFNIKTNSAYKIAEAMARMVFVQSNFEEKFLGKAEGLIDKQVKLQEELLKRSYKAQMENFEDIQCIYNGLEFNVKIDGRKRRFNSRYYDPRLSRSAMIIYLTTRKLTDEVGKNNISISELKARLNYDDTKLNFGLEELKNTGYIYLLKNGTEIHLLHLGKFSDIFDELAPR
jgi:hypothetical protein